MMRAVFVRLLSLGFLVCAVGLILSTGCTSPATRFYILNPVGDLLAVRPSAVLRSIVVGVGPVELPYYLDRPQFVRRTPGNELEVDEFSQWAEPLEDGFLRTLAENLSHLVPIERVVYFPWRRADAVRYQVSIRVIRFEADTTGEARLDARWSIIREEGDERLVTKRSGFRAPADSGDHGAIAAALSATLGDLSQAIASEIRAVAVGEAQGGSGQPPTPRTDARSNGRSR